MRQDLDSELARLAELTDAWMREAVERHLSPRAQRLAGMLEYHFGWRGSDLQPLPTPAPTGKKLRPGLVLLVSRAVSGEITPAARASAVAVEFVHNFSLVHDDIQDRSEMRHHRPTVWTLWGMPQAINVGDAMFAIAQRVMVEDGSSMAAQLSREMNATVVLLAEGQFLDLDMQDGEIPPTLETYDSMIARKTAVLFSCACRMGAMSAGATPAQCDAYADFGLELGVAFQEQDDLLGVWGKSSETGKPDAADIVERKRGLPAAMALSEPDAPEWLRAVYAEHEGGVTTETIDRVIVHFDALGLRKRIESRVEARYRKALGHLESASPREPARGYLTAMGDWLLGRKK